MMDLPKVYSPTDVEEKWYKIWEENNYFSPEIIKNAKLGPFVIVIPPPNVTGMLHMGHALDETLQDILIRYKRLRGYETLWVPGTDHAGIATQNVVEKQLAKEGLKKEQIGREEFLKKVWQWKEQYGGTITKQLRRLGASCDWTRERFTMDQGLSDAVKKAFVSLYNDGLIYRGKRMVNWCPRCTTAISDIEVEHESKKGSLWHIKYPIENSKEYIVVATTRPETMLGDMAVAVNPKDERYLHLIGKNLILPLTNRSIPIIADDFVDTTFGTGCVKVTPAHDPNDFDMGERHNLQKLNILTVNGKITLEDFNANEINTIAKYEGLTREKAREEIIKDLEEKGLIDKIEDHENSTGKCYRCKTIIEPYLSDQWYVKVAPLAKKAIEAVKNGSIEYFPQRWTKVYLDWMENLRDWCISRQIWWGHRIPVWYCDCGEIIVSETEPEECPKCSSQKLRQDEDVLDTWFSSSLWPFSTLGWPDQTNDLKKYYPTSVLVTGYDIITFWVSKMIMMGINFMGVKPFGKIFIHGLIRDVTGKKMSKSIGNVIDPIEVINNVGADALRFSLSSLVTSGGQDLKLSDEKILEGRNFANKIWNVSRFVLMQGDVKQTKIDQSKLSLADKWILSRYNSVVKQVSDLLDNFEFGECAKILYEFIWSEFCDWYIEMSKNTIYSAPDKPINPNKENTLLVLRTLLEGILKLLHPYMPFETEEIYSYLEKEKTIMLSDWPEYKKEEVNSLIDSNVGQMIEIVRAIRNIRAEMNVAQNKEIDVLISAGEHLENVAGLSEYIKSLVKASRLEVKEAFKEKPKQSATAVAGSIEIYVPLEGLIDVAIEIQRLEKSKAEMAELIIKVEAKLSNENFVGRAKPELVEAEKVKLAEYINKKKIVEDRLLLLN